MREIGSNAAYLLLFAALVLVPGQHYDSERAWTLLIVLLVLRVAGGLLVHRANPAYAARVRYRILPRVW